MSQLNHLVQAGFDPVEENVVATIHEELKTTKLNMMLFLLTIFTYLASLLLVSSPVLPGVLANTKRKDCLQIYPVQIGHKHIAAHEQELANLRGNSKFVTTG